jgi:hypothetical protein
VLTNSRKAEYKNYGWSHLYEGWAGGLHLADEKIIPPYCTPPIAVFFRLSNEEHWTADDDRNEEREEVQEAFSGEERLPYAVMKEG